MEALDMAQLQFKGKTFVQNHHLLVKYHELVPVKAKSLTDKVTLHDNLIIHGDNLKGLKALLPLYAGKVKCVCIDPPYNTGNEGWAYNDNVNSPMMEEWLGKIVDREDLTRHDKWLCMMMPRLKLLRELMADDGIIFVCIDDCEAQRLHLLLDEVFGEENFLAVFVRRRRMATGMRGEPVSPDHEYILAFAKRKAAISLSGSAPNEDDYPFTDAKGKFRSTDLTVGMTKEMRPNQYYPLMKKGGKAQYLPPENRIWRFQKTTMKEHIEADNIIWPEDWPEKDLIRPRFKTRYDPSQSNPISTWIDSKSVECEGLEDTSVRLQAGLNQEATKELRQVFQKQVLDYPKPVSLVRSLIRTCTSEKDIILDSFAGSGTTAHAVLAQNAEDGGNRRFILIECEDYADKITAERVRRVIKGVPTAKDDALKRGFGGTFSFFKIGKAIELESILDGKALPTFEDLARYVFYTATGEEFDPKAVDRKKLFVGESRNYQVFLLYEPDVAKLKNMALTLDIAQALPKLQDGKRRLVFAPTKYLDQDHLDQFRIDFAQLPFEIYELTR
jgi:adenine-specific DNA-methyltransferase